MKTRGKEIGQQLAMIFLFVIFPFIVHMSMVPTGLESYSWYPDVSEDADFFLCARSRALTVFAVFLIGALLVQMWTRRKDAAAWRKKLRDLWPLGIYVLLVILSCICSEDSRLSLFQSADMTETVWVLLAYLTVFLYFYLTASQDSREKAIRWILIGALPQLFIGIGQMAGADFWSSMMGKALICLGHSTDGLTFTFSESREVYLSFYNPNYAAIYLVLMLPFAVYGVWHFKKKPEKYFAAVTALLILICLYGTGSRAGAVTVLALFLLVLIRNAGTGRQRALILGGGLLAAAMISLAGLLLPTENPVRTFYKSIFPEKKIYKLQSVTLQENTVRVDFNGHILQLRLETEDGESWFSVADDEESAYELKGDDEGYYQIPEEDFDGLQLAAYETDGTKYLVMRWNDLFWRFYKREADTKYNYVNVYGRTDEIIEAPTAFGAGHERALSKRVYIWGRTVPLLKDYLLVGSGPNTFITVFPQNDYVMRANITSARTRQLIAQLSKKEQENADARAEVAAGQMAELTSRPHSFYLQQAVQTGCLSLICLLFFFGKYLYRSWKTGAKSPYLYAVIGYLILCLANDSLVVTAPFLWAILGLSSENA